MNSTLEESKVEGMAANRKRSRTERNKNNHEEDEDEAFIEHVCLQTPHTLRLLRLIEEGTLEHARIAASHLASLNASPVVLWDLLGRLQAFLLSSQWSTRFHASLAMQGVAQHIPPIDQREFLEATYEGPLWLTVEEMSQGLDTILTEGQVLLAESDTKEDSFATQEGRLKKLDDSREELQDDFVEQRVRLQREILAQRLGLGGFVQAVGGSVLSDVITNEDLLLDENTSARQSQSRKRIKRQRCEENEDISLGSIRALLVMEMQQQQNQTRGATSHINPQTLLATELIYRMFDPSWHVRHGAFLGTLSLLRAWKGVVGQHSFGMWPHDIMARCLCVLALDQFGDYAGASLEGGGAREGGDSVVAPVREMAGQLLSVLWATAPNSVRNGCLQVLVRMSSQEQWEIRHGAFLGLKYIVVISSSNVLKKMKGASLNDTVKEILHVAQERLSDKMEDVQSVAAQILLSILNDTQEKEAPRRELIRGSCLPLWNVLGQLRSISSCAVDFVALFSAMICVDFSLVCKALECSLDQGPFALGVIAKKLADFLDFDSVTVNLSAFKAIGSIAGPYALMITENNGQDVPASLVDGYCLLLERVFLSYSIGRFAAVPYGDDKESHGQFESFCGVRDTAWMQLVDGAASVLQISPSHRENILVRLLSSYVKIQQHSISPTADTQKSRSACAIARLLTKLDDADFGTSDVLTNSLETLFGLLLNSPWEEHCESACILYQAVNSYGHPLLRRSHALLNQFLEDAPPCLSPHRVKISSTVPSMPTVIDPANHAFSLALTSLFADGDESNNFEQERFWHAALSERFEFPIPENERGSVTITTSSMRIHSLIAGAIVSGGEKNLPSRLTPLVRALMTSLKSERNSERQILTCKSLALLLKNLYKSDDESRLRVRSKILENVRVMLSTCPSQELQGVDSCQAATHVIALLISQLSSDETLTSIPPMWNRLRLLGGCHSPALDENSLLEYLRLLAVICKALKRGTAVTRHIIENMTGPLVPVACTYKLSGTRAIAANVIVSLCQTDPLLAMDASFPSILKYLGEKDDDLRRLGSLRLLQSVIEGVGMDICPFVHCLLPIVMSLMTDSLEDCAKQAAQSFAALVRVSPLVKQTERRQWEGEASKNQSDKVLDHLIHGKPLPPCVLPSSIVKELNTADISLRDYQVEGIAWLQFLQQVGLKGILAGTWLACVCICNHLMKDSPAACNER